MEGCLRKLTFLCFALSSTAWADAVNNEWFSTTRALSMGNVGIASSEDSTTAMFYNPAALTRTKKVHFEFLNPQVDVSTYSHGNMQDVTKRIDLGAMRPVLEKYPGKPTYTGGTLYPNIAAQNFNFGVLMRGEGGAYFSGTALHYKSRYLLIPTLGMSLGALGGRFRLGFAARVIQITDNDKSVEGYAANDRSGGVGFMKDPGEGMGIGLDGGTMITLPVPALPTVGFVARNVGDTSFSGSAPFGVGTGNISRKEKIKMTYDVGGSLTPRFGKKNQMVFAADYRDIQDKMNVTTKRRINLGMELGLQKKVFFRFGLSRGYWTAGIGIASDYGSLDIGSYAEELDATEFRKVEDRRISIRIGSKF